jgi:LysM domain-containing protein
VEEDGRPTLTGEPTDPPLDRIAWDQRVEPAPPASGDHVAAMIAALADPATRSPRPDTCPFLRTIDASGAPLLPIEMPDPSNRCVAVGEPSPQSARQQQLVCLSSGHSNCPRYLRGAQVAAEVVAPPQRRNPSVPVVASALILVAAAAMSVGFLLVRGGFEVPAAASLSSQVAVEPSPSVVAAEPTASAPVAAETASPAAPPSPSAPSPSPSPSAAPTPTPPSTPAPTPAPTAAATPLTGTAARYALLVACPDAKNCWVYTVRSGDNFQSIVNWFGVPYETVLRMNPQLGNPKNIRAGDKIRIPPPTR